MIHLTYIFMIFRRCAHMSKKLGDGVALVGALAGAGALATALVKKK